MHRALPCFPLALATIAEQEVQGVMGCTWEEITAFTPKPSRQVAEKQTHTLALHWDNDCPWKEILTVVRAWA